MQGEEGEGGKVEGEEGKWEGRRGEVEEGKGGWGKGQESCCCVASAAVLATRTIAALR